MMIMSYPISNAFSQQAALGFLEGGLLEEYWTCLRWRRGTWLDRVLPGALTRELRRRALPPELDRALVRTSPWREAGRMLAARVPGGRSLSRHETGPLSVDRVFQALDRRVARRLSEVAGVRGVYAYEDGAEATFAAAGRLGMKRLYDLPIGYWRAGHEIYAEEEQREPAWAATLTGRADSPEKLARKDAELAQADAIFTASTFTRQTLALAPGVRCPVHVISYAAPPPIAALPAVVSTPVPRKLRILFAGSLGQRKGLSYLLDAVARLGEHVELTLLGSKTVEGCHALDAAVRTHRWIPSLPHPAVLEEMERQDVLVFPSLFEGFGLVILEAMSRGLPVIATAHTAAPDLFTDGEEGFLVPIRSADAIVEKLEILIRDPEQLRALKSAALARAATHRWETYRRRLTGAVRQTLVDAPCHADA